MPWEAMWPGLKCIQELSVLNVVPLTSVYLGFSIHPVIVTVALQTQAYHEDSGSDFEVLGTRPGAKLAPSFAMR